MVTLNRCAERKQSRARARNMRAKYLVLVLYVAIAYWQTKWWQLAIINTAAFLAMDGVHACLGRGRVNWTPGYQVLVMCVGRIFVSSAAGLRAAAVPDVARRSSIRTARQLRRQRRRQDQQQA